MLFYSLQNLLETFPIRRPIEDYAINVHRSGRMLITTEFSGWIFENSNAKIHEKPSSGNRGVPRKRRDIQIYGQTDGLTDVNN